jgi:hypothetical protein
MKIIEIRILLLLFSCLVGVNTNAQFITSIMESRCSTVLMGGSYYHLIDPDYDNKSLYAYDFNDGPAVRRRVYSVGVEPFNDPKLSLSCGYIAFLEPNKARDAQCLRVITAAGQDGLLLPGVLVFDWGINASKEDLLAYSVGVPQAEDSEIPPAGEIWIRNIKTDEQWKIHSGRSVVTWAEFDSSFYIVNMYKEDDTTRVSRYNYKTRQLERTAYLGFSFSTGGTYYYVDDVEGDGFRLFDRVKNVDITEEFLELYKYVPYGRVSAVGWISDSMLVLQSETGRSEGGHATQQIIDFKTAQLWEVGPEVVGLLGQGGRDLVQVTKSGATSRPFSDVATLIYPVPDDTDAANATTTERKAE